jgi:hypothetical protein
LVESVETPMLKKYFFLRCANFFVGIGFPTMQTALENYTFLPFSVFLALFWVFTYKKVFRLGLARLGQVS